MSTIVTGSFKFVGDLVQKVGPYLLLEILLPGGTVFALLLFLYRQRQQLGTEGIASLWRGRHPDHDGLEALGIVPIV
jgi:hypothetical protein